MKILFTSLIAVVSLAATAQQSVTLTFPAAAKNAKSYQIVIDGVSYYSANSVNNNGRRVTTIGNLSDGAHNIEVYTTNSRNADGSTTRPSTRAAYTKTFQLRDGYDMNIAIRGNGQVSFTEKRSEGTATSGYNTPMNATTFSQLYQSISTRRYQSDKVTLVRNSLNNSANYFTTTQLRQLISLVNSESRRLELAKLSYARVTDPANFSSLYDILQSEASRDALDQYVVAQGGSIQSNESNTAYGSVISETNFTTLLNRIRSYSYQSGRVSEIRTALQGSSYFTVSQVRQMLNQLSSEADRLAVAKLAYSRVVDPGSFKLLSDLFYQTAYRNEFNTFILNNGGTTTTTTSNQQMADAAFQDLYNKARGHFFQWNTVSDIQTALNSTTNYFSTQQISLLLQLVSSETSRLELAKLGYARAVDPMNYSSLMNLFVTEANRVELDNYIRSKQ